MWFLLPCNLFCLKIATILKNFTKPLILLFLRVIFLLQIKKKQLTGGTVNEQGH